MKPTKREIKNCKDLDGLLDWLKLHPERREEILKQIDHLLFLREFPEDTKLRVDLENRLHKEEIICGPLTKAMDESFPSMMLRDLIHVLYERKDVNVFELKRLIEKRIHKFKHLSELKGCLANEKFVLEFAVHFYPLVESATYKDSGELYLIASGENMPGELNRMATKRMEEILEEPDFDSMLVWLELLKGDLFFVKRILSALTMLVKDQLLESLISCYSSYSEKGPHGRKGEPSWTSIQRFNEIVLFWIEAKLLLESSEYLTEMIWDGTRKENQVPIKVIEVAKKVYPQVAYQELK
jgi:hypothetical protein